jgi:formiminoglutamase
VRDIGDIQMHPTEVLRCHDNIEEGLSELYQQSPSFVPIIVGGNHAIAAPSVRASRNGNDYKKVGLVDFDAHNDLGDPALGGPTAGTMFRQVIDAGQIEGRNAVQIGLHGSLGTVDQRDYASSVDLREIPAREVWQRGIERVMDEAMAQAGDGTDAIEDASVPGTGVPAPGGSLPKRPCTCSAETRRSWPWTLWKWTPLRT